jgi:hypothetical protein
MADLAYIGPGGRGVLTPPGEPVQSVIEMFERLLDDARSGKIVAAAVATVVDQGVKTGDFECAFRGGTYGDLYLCVAQMNHRMMTDAS